MRALLWIIFIPVLGKFVFSKLQSWIQSGDNEIRDFVFIDVSIILIVHAITYLVWTLTGNVSIVINDRYMKIERRILGIISWNKCFVLSQIENAEYRVVQESNTYWSVTGLQFADKNPIVFHFDYKRKHFTVGNKLHGFNAADLKKEIAKRQQF